MIKKIKDNQDFIGFWFFITSIIVIGVVARIMLIPITSGDQQQFLLPWYETIKENGGFKAVGMEIGDYMPTYYYLIALATYIPAEPIVVLKIFSCIGDFALAIMVLLVVNEVTHDIKRGALAFATVFMFPTVALNSAGWSQCDSMFTLFLIGSLYFILKGKDIKAVVFFSIAFVFKIQAIFFAPVIFLLILKGKIRWRACLAFPIVYLIDIIPALINGGNFLSLLTVYFRQPGQFTSLNMRIPNIWSMVYDVVDPKRTYIGEAGVMLAGAVVLCFMYYIFTKKFKLTAITIVTMSTMFAILLPYVLPHMHERYYYFAGIMCVILAFVAPSKFWIAITFEFCSASSIMTFLLGQEHMEMSWLFVFATVAFIGVILFLIKLIKENEEATENGDKGIEILREK